MVYWAVTWSMSVTKSGTGWEEEILPKMLDHWLSVRVNVLYVPLKSVNTQIFPQAQCSCPIFDVFSISLPPKLSRPLKESQRTLLELLFQHLLMLRGPPMVPLSPKGALVITCHRQQRCPMFWVSPYTALSLSNYSLSASINYSFAFFFQWTFQRLYPRTN